MADSLKDAAVEIALQASENHTVEKDIAMYIKKEMDRCVERKGLPFAGALRKGLTD